MQISRADIERIQGQHRAEGSRNISEAKTEAHRRAKAGLPLLGRASRRHLARQNNATASEISWRNTLFRLMCYRYAGRTDERYAFMAGQLEKQLGI